MDLKIAGSFWSNRLIDFSFQNEIIWTKRIGAG